MVKPFGSLLHYYHLLLCRVNAAWCAVEEEKNKIIKNMKKQVFFIYLSFRIAFLFCFWENVWFYYYVACYYCFGPLGKHSNSRSQMFYKIDALKIDALAMFTGKDLCWRFLLINFIKKRLKHGCFPVNISKCLSTAFYIEHLWFIILLKIFMWWSNSLDVFGHKIDIFMFLVPLLCFPS